MKNRSRGPILAVCVAALLVTSTAKSRQDEPEAMLLALQPAQVAFGLCLDSALRRWAASIP